MEHRRSALRSVGEEDSAGALGRECVEGGCLKLFLGDGNGYPQELVG